ncbi:putative mfs alpha-glucoside transporter [Phaeomoniella chlamydospora]|uniref:Putative mfs alpha-glucoside transporter n=1 Tax=Phaeomoniella chlamydospora TaxID=158046 RepID=A0A0G2H6H1_PHACM|nr:putative mfs alpha-glucoside transporter [Phaeomoniella chlamydospora]
MAKLESQVPMDVSSDQKDIAVDVIVDYDLIEASKNAARREHSLTIREAASQHRSAVLWAAFFCLPNLIIGYDPTILGTLVGIPEFRRRFGYEHPPGSGEYVLAASWTSAFNYAPIIGFLVASIWGGWCVDRYGPRKTLLGATILSLGTLLIEVLGESAAVIFVGDLLTGLLTGSFPVLGPAYISEILPVCLRGMGLSCNNLAQVLGSFIGIGILRGTENRTDKWAYKVPFITEYAFPIIFIVGGFLAPETPWFLVKRGRYEEAAKSLKRTGYSEDVDNTLAHMKETILLEDEVSKSATYLDCFRGTNCRRTLTCAMAYSGQFLCGINLASSYCTYFFELAGVTTNQAFDLSLGLFGLGVVGNLISWPLMTIWGRRGGYISTCCVTTLLMFLIGFLGLAPSSNNGAMYAKSIMLLLFNFVYNIGLGPIVYVLIAELPNTRIRGKTLGIACFVPHILSIAITAGLPYAMSTAEANWGAKTAFLFAGLSIIVLVWAFFYLPESKGRTFEELDILFERKIPARRFASTDLTDFDRGAIVHG